MKHTNIFLRWICLVMLLASVGVCWGQTTWTRLIGGGALASGNYQIQETNLDIGIPITIESGSTVTVDLKGYVLRGLKIPYVIHVKSGGKLTIKDSNPSLGHKGRVNIETGLWSWDDADAEHVQQNISGGIIYNTQQEDTDSRGIFVEGECIIEYAKILGCYSKEHGGAVLISSSGSFEMKGGQISYNYAGTKGAGIYGEPANKSGALGAVIKISDTTISYNNAGTGGAGIYGDDLDLEQCVLEYNDTPEYGGAIHATYAVGSKLNVENCMIRYNRAGIRGGGIYSVTRSYIKNSTIDGNWAATTETNEPFVNLGRGGGFCFTKNKDVESQEAILDNTEVKNNICMYYGGGGEVLSGAHLIMKNGSKIYKNEVLLHGAGALHVSGDAKFTLEDGEMYENLAQSVGGAIHSSYKCELNLVGGKIYNNTVYGRGGGVHVNTGGELELQGTIITGNKALKGSDYIKCEIEKGTDGKYSWKNRGSEGEEDKTGYGGGVLIDAGTCKMTKGSLSGNYAQAGGGGIGLVMINMNLDTSDSHFRDLEVVEFSLTPEGDNIVNVKDNKSDGDGAGIYLMENTMSPKLNDVTSDDSEIQAQIEKIKKGIPKAIINGGILSGNIAEGNGGALLVNGDVTMTDGTFTKNKAVKGGGICIIGGTVNITKGTITENEATNYGGGIYVENTDPNAEITLSGEGIFEKNTAKAGGGMAVNGPFTFNFAGTIQNNNAENGGGIYLLKGTGSSDAAKGATLHFQGGFIRNNTATGTPKLTDKTAYQKDVDAVTGVGGGVFMADYTTLDFDVTNTLGFYGNRATNAADDIFANGKGTSVTLPPVANMTLSDFSVPAGELFWAEDYYSHYEKNDTYESDADYANGTNGLASGLTPDHNLRYQFALQNLKRGHVTKVEANTFNNSHMSKYVCLALGYQIFYVTIKKTGLKEDESAFFHISSTKTDANIPNPYITMLLTGGEGSSTVEKKVALPEGEWKVTENTAWGWSYTPTEPTEVTQFVNADNIEFSFSNAKNNEDLHDEAIMVNEEMGKKKQ